MSKTISRSHPSSKAPLKKANTPKEVSPLKKTSSAKQTAITRPAPAPEAYIVRKRIDLNARPSEVWDALTNPEKTKKYFFNSRVTSDWKPGSPITFKGRMFLIIPYEMQGQIIKADPEKILKYTLQNKQKGNKPASTSTVTDTLTYSNGLTTLSISDDVGNGEGAEERYHRSMAAWDKVLAGLKKLLENGKS